MAGAVRSSFTLADCDAYRPAAFSAEQVSVVPSVSAEIVTGAHPVDEAIDPSASVTFQVTVTGLLCHPAGFADAESTASMTGGVVSGGGPLPNPPPLTLPSAARVKSCDATAPRDAVPLTFTWWPCSSARSAEYK